MSYIVDEGVENKDIGRIMLYGAIMLGIAAAGAFSAVMRSRFASKTSQIIGKELRRDIYHNVQQLSLENIDRLQPASIITRITNDVTQLQDFINGLMRIMAKAPITCIGAIVLIIVQTPRQAPVMLVILIIASILIYCNIRVGYPRFGLVQRKLDKLNGVTREFLSSVRVVKAFRAEDEESEKFEAASGELAAANTSAMRVMAVFIPFVSLTVNFGIVMLLWISKSQDSEHIGRLMASINYMTHVLFAVVMISNVINNAVRAMASAERITEVLSETPAQKQPENPLRPEITGDIVFENVSFTYSGAANESLKNINIHIPAGKTVGIIGPTGSGKTTLVNLVPRFYDAGKGRILVDGCDVTQIDESLLRTAIAVVPQKSLLFTGTIMENLRWGSSDAGDEEIYEAARTACADEFIRAAENGYDTRLGQGGVNLSGGQKQRVSLARALIRKPKILVLDDCTSALDAQTEYSVLRGLREKQAGATVLLISQRISTVMRADIILCMGDGRVQGYGTHAELMQGCRLYREIYESQIGAVEAAESTADKKNFDEKGVSEYGR
ncbi:MAG: ABC transporter ATP-binding protein/permease [Lachnospiraceae bacterium]|nr:ABC transporter ATP-binding protein/permease [Lachnospiraceae bacterium]